MRHIFGGTTTSRFFVWMFLLFFVVLQQDVVHANIYIDKNHIYDSMPAVFGKSFGDHSSYKLHLQYLPDHPYLCDEDGLIVESVYGRRKRSVRRNLREGESSFSSYLNDDSHANHTTTTTRRPNSVVPPQDGIPVALLVSRGSCSFEEKARTAQSLFGGENNIQFIIIFDDRSSKRSSTTRLVPMSATDPVGIHISLLFCSKLTGQELIQFWSRKYDEYYYHEDGVVNDDDDAYTNNETSTTTTFLLDDDVTTFPPFDGPIITIDAIAPTYPNAPYYKDAQQWILAAMAGFFTFLACFGCLLVCVQAGYLPAETAQLWLDRAAFNHNNNNTNNNNNNNLYPNNGFIKTLLTPNQVQELPEIQYYEKQEEDQPSSSSTTTSSSICCKTIYHNNTSSSSSICAICLEEYNIGEVLKKLPSCGHLFHTNCLLPWLTERSANCPLCKAQVVIVGDDDETEYLFNQQQSNTTSTNNNTRSSLSASLATSPTWWRSYGTLQNVLPTTRTTTTTRWTRTQEETTTTTNEIQGSEEEDMNEGGGGGERRPLLLSRQTT